MACLLAAACGEGGSQEPAPTARPTPPPAPAVIEVAPGKPLIVGLSVAMSGEQAAIGADLVTAAQMAVEDFGAVVGGHLVGVEPRDDACTDPRKAVDVAGILTAIPALIGVVGPMCAIGAQAANPAYEAAMVVHLAPTATRTELSDGGSSFFFRTAWRDDAQAAVQARYLSRTLEARTVFLIDDAEPYGVRLAEAFEDAFAGEGGQVTEHQRVERGETEFGVLARQVVQAAPAAVVFQGLNPEGALLVKALREAGYAGIFMGPDGLLSLRDFVPTAGPASEGAVLTGGPVATPEFVARFTERTGHSPTTPFVLQVYDAVTALLKGASAVAATAPDGALSLDRAQLAQAIREQRFAGLSGSITFDERGDRRGETAPELGLRVYRIENAGLVIVE